MSKVKIGIAGAGTMGSGIAQVAAQSGHEVLIFDRSQEALQRSKAGLEQTSARLIEKGKWTPDEGAAMLDRMQWTSRPEELKDCGWVIEAIIEDKSIKQKLFRELEGLVAPDAVLASNTSSLPITALAAGLERPERMLGLHFFNPAPLLPLVEVIPALQTRSGLAAEAMKLMESWGKVPVLAKDTPGFIVNRLARPFYGESLRILEEGLASAATIDWALKSQGGFKMGPFELMDLIGNDVNYAVTCSVFESFYYDPRYRPSLTQKMLVEAGWLGKKTGRGYYSYAQDARNEVAVQDAQLARRIFERVLAMLVNEAVEACYLNIAAPAHLDLAVTKGVNYPKGLLAWGLEWGPGNVLAQLRELQATYGDDRYRSSALLHKWAEDPKYIDPAKGA